MCGIAGIVNLDKNLVDRGVLAAMIAVQKHRGPDDEGIFISNNVGLGHARLSIIDLSEKAHQPMMTQDKSLVIIYNGEIYNYIELRNELKTLGHAFRSSSDTEVILEAFKEWGHECPLKFNGMFAFAVYDVKNQELFIARDRFGVKPLYFYSSGNVFLFSSEIKALLMNKNVKKEVNDEAVFDYLISGYGYLDISDYTFFKGVNKLMPSHYIRLDVRTGKFEAKRYTDVQGKPLKAGISEEGHINAFSEIFKNAVELRLRSDVKVGISLSGGLDSTSIACIASRAHKGMKLMSFSSVFKEKDADERRYIEKTLMRANLDPVFVSTLSQDVFKSLEKIIWHQEEPYSTLSILPQWNVMKAAHDRNVKVLLSGQGGDEVLGGYHKYYFYLFADLFASFKWTSMLKEMEIYEKKINPGAKVWPETIKIALSSRIPAFLKRQAAKYERPPYLNSEFAGHFRRKEEAERQFSSILNNALYNGLRVSPLPSLLHIDDRASMAHSVETRSPFLDYRLVDCVFSMPTEYKIRNGITKYILRKAMKGIIPDEVLERKDKMGFPTPLKAWLKTDLKKDAGEILSSKEFQSRPYFNHKEVLNRFDECLKGRTDELTIWSWINLELWFRKFID